MPCIYSVYALSVYALLSVFIPGTMNIMESILAIRLCYIWELTLTQGITRVGLTYSHKPLKSREIPWASGRRRHQKDWKYKKDCTRGASVKMEKGEWGKCISTSTDSKRTETGPQPQGTFCQQPDLAWKWIFPPVSRQELSLASMLISALWCNE